jgi:hypothetical protein
MGLLDEAIREHLELKRRRGADPTEIERLEREALGPVRRVGQDTPASETVGVESAEPVEHGFLDEAIPSGDQPGHEDPYPLEPDYEIAAEREDEYSAHEPEAPEDPSPHAAEPGRALADIPEEHGIPPTPGPVPPGGGHPVDEDPGVETAEYDVEAGHAEETEGEDVLEETPEFFQDAPDHDRLWFEQRPPRDFDFDG